LKARMEITAYNLHWRLLSLRVLVFVELKFTRPVVGAVVVIESNQRRTRDDRLLNLVELGCF
jgi:hypothetical protein